MTVIIVGGGINGLSIGWSLARAGSPVTILERGEAGRGATWAAAGTLVPWVEYERHVERQARLEFKGHALWADFVRELEADADTALDYCTEGLLVVGLDEADVKRLEHEYELQTRLGLPLEWLSGDEAHRLEPRLTPSIAAGVFCPLGHWVDPRRVARALRAAYLRAGGMLREGAEVREIVVEMGQVRGVRLDGDTLPADTVVLAAGAWSQTVGGLPDSARPPVHPVKGQMLAVRVEDASPIRHTVWGPEADLIPRSDGRLLIGATVEDAGFDTQPTGEATEKLLRGAEAFFPEIRQFPIVETWAGLRPGSPDDGPILGPTEVSGLILATGHYKRGIQLAPLTAQAITKLVLTGELAEEVRPFTLARFSVK